MEQVKAFVRISCCFGSVFETFGFANKTKITGNFLEKVLKKLWNKISQKLDSTKVINEIRSKCEQKKVEKIDQNPILHILNFQLPPITRLIERLSPSSAHTQPHRNVTQQKQTIHKALNLGIKTFIGNQFLLRHIASYCSKPPKSIMHFKSVFRRRIMLNYSIAVKNCFKCRRRFMMTYYAQSSARCE
jgi:hypothetical protein